MSDEVTGAAEAAGSDEGPLLAVDGLSLTFGGLTVLDDVGFDLRSGELLGLIGPNGAGKTSLFNCLNGVYVPDRGSIRLDGEELVGRRPSDIGARGMARTFQNLALFENLDVIDNLLLGRHHLMRTGVVAGMVWFGRARREEREHRRFCAGLVDLLGLGGHIGRPVGDLAYGVRKRIELGRALAMEPKVLLLDEPVAGMNAEETDTLAHTLLDIEDEFGLAMILIDHDMHFVTELARRLVVVNFGRVIASGTPDEVVADPAVIEAYVGETAR